MINIKKHLNLLGYKVKDRVTGFKGVVTSISFDLYGCVQAVINPGIYKNGKFNDSHYFDVSRLEILSNDTIIEVPNFDFGPQAEGKQGAAEKPLYNKV